MASFRTIQKAAEGSYKEKGSKFLAYAFPIVTEEETKTRITQVKAEHPQARHVCYAYRFRTGNSEVYKSHDAAEPPNSAGAPILGVIRSQNLTNIIIIVVRYFGGSKLGIPGLIHAYKTAANNALENTTLIDDFEKYIFSIEFDYDHLSEIMNFIRTNNVMLKSEVFGENCIFTLATPIEEREIITNRLQHLTYVSFR